MTTSKACAIALLSALGLASTSQAQAPVTLTFAAHYTDSEMTPLGSAA